MMSEEPCCREGADDGIACYSTYCLDRGPVLRDVLPTLMKAVDKVPYDLQDGRPIVIAEYACQNGSVTLEIFREVVGHIRVKYNPSPDVSIVYDDLPSSDFKSLFLIANGLLGTDPHLAWSRQPRVYFSAVGRDYYEQCLPTNSVHIGVNSLSVQFLSRRPCRIPNALHHSLIEDADILDLHATQAAHDWETFLLRRCKELIPGGLLFVVAFVTSHDSHLHRQTKQGNNIFRVIQNTWENFLKDGRINQEEFDHPAYSTYYRTPEEFEAPFSQTKSAVYQAGLRLESLQTKTTKCAIPKACVSCEIGDPKNVAHFALELTDHFRTFGSVDFINALRSRPEAERKEIVDELFWRLEEEIKAAPSDFQIDVTHACMVMRKII